VSKPKKQKINWNKIPEIYKLPVIVTKEYLELEKEYLNYYNDEFWEKYKKEKAKKYGYA
jgi:hypothetical protein